MELQVTFNDESSSTQDCLKVTKKLGMGKFSVFKVESTAENKSYALKVFPKDTFGAMQYNKEKLMSSLSHRNVIKQIPITISESVNFYPVLAEFAMYGDFFELVTKEVFDKDILIRTYFHQLIDGLEYIHSQGLAHLDLKLENLMMGSDFVLKIIDFDQSQRITDRKMTSGGTNGYRAPEVLNGTCHNFAAVDVYSAGVILYAFKAVEYPFMETTVQDVNTKKNSIHLKYYSTFMRNNKAFWQMKSTLKKDKSFFSEDFIELVNGMLKCDANKRLTIKQIKESKWYNGPIFSNEKLKTEMQTRWTNLANKVK